MFKTLKKLIPERSPLRLFWHHTRAFVAALRYGFPARHLTIIGVTGTDGKTTTVAMTAHILRKAGKSVGAASTAFLDLPGDHRENASHLTSLSPFTLQRFLCELVQRGCTHAVIEASSHGLVQGRLNFLFPRVSVITNTAPEHLDYHGTLEQYRKDKGILFRMLRKNGTKVLNASDGSFSILSAIPARHTVTYGGPESDDLSLTDRHADAEGVHASLHTALGGEMMLRLPVPGLFNLDNALAAIAAADALGIPLETSVSALSNFSGVPGRLERIDEGQAFSVFVDFAVTPQAYEKTLETLREMVGERGRVLVLASSCGNRMKEKRPEIGRVVSALADIVVVTEDETYGEDPLSVIDEVWAGIDQGKTEAHKIPDRREAIVYLLTHARPGDAIAVCGMGPFTTMTTLQGRIPWDEREIVREELRRMRG